MLGYCEMRASPTQAGSGQARKTGRAWRPGEIVSVGGGKVGVGAGVYVLAGMGSTVTEMFGEGEAVGAAGACGAQAESKRVKNRNAKCLFNVKSQS